MLYLPLDKLIQEGGQTKLRETEGNGQLIDRIANQVIEKLQRNVEQTPMERRRLAIY
jgi:membrane protease subunit HflK